jgi:hypothetical protein
MLVATATHNAHAQQQTVHRDRSLWGLWQYLAQQKHTTARVRVGAAIGVALSRAEDSQRTAVVVQRCCLLVAVFCVLPAVGL